MSRTIATVIEGDVYCLLDKNLNVSYCRAQIQNNLISEHVSYVQCIRCLQIAALDARITAQDIQEKLNKFVAWASTLSVTHPHISDVEFIDNILGNKKQPEWLQ